MMKLAQELSGCAYETDPEEMPVKIHQIFEDWNGMIEGLSGPCRRVETKCQEATV